MFAVFSHFYAGAGRFKELLGMLLFTDTGAELYTDTGLPIYTD